MIKKLGTFLFGLLVVSATAQPVVTPPIFIPIVSGGTPFVLPTGDVIHYMSPTGNDSNNGLTPATAWASGNHVLNCGDVIIAAAGTYNGNMNTWGQTVNCPSTTGGIDGSGGIYAAVVLCAGDLGTNGCIINCATATCATGAGDGTHGNAVKACMQLNKNYWSIQGWTCDGNTTTGRGFQVDNCLSATTNVHHVMLINDYAKNTNQGFGATGCLFSGSAVPGNGHDYVAYVGTLANNAAQDNICLAALDFVGNTNTDTNAGTHLYAYGNFVANSSSSSGGCTNSDVEAFLLDTPDGHAYSNTVVFANNVAWNSWRFGIQLFYQNYHSTNITVKILNNTFYNNDTHTGSDFADGEINISSSNQGGLNVGVPWTMLVNNNIAQQTHSTSPTGGNRIYAATWAGSLWTSGSNNTNGNVLKGAAVSCAGTCDSGNNAVEFNGNTLGTQTYTDPLFSNTSDLNTNWLGTINCSGFSTTTACMGYNATTATLTSNTPIADLTASCAGCSGKGFQLPSSTCNSNTDYPSYLKGLVRLQWNSVSLTITQVHDLVTTPCGL